MTKKDWQRHMAYEALVILGVLARPMPGAYPERPYKLYGRGRHPDSNQAGGPQKGMISHGHIHDKPL